MNKKLAIFTLGLLGTVGVNAQLFNQDALWGAALGGAAGAIIGNQHHGQSGEGAAIGAGVGYLLGQGVHNSRRHRTATYSYPSSQYPYYSSGYYSGYSPNYSSYGNVYYGGQGYSGYGRSSYSRRPNYALTGAALGGVAGAVIGNQHHGQTGEGAAIGAAAGLLLGGVAEHQARKREREWAAEVERVQSVPAYTAPAQTKAPVTQQAPKPIRQTPTSNLGGANKLFGR